MTTVFGIAFAAVLAALLFVAIPARSLAAFLRTFIPLLLVVSGALLVVFARQTSLGSLLVFAGVALWGKLRGVGSFGGGAQPRGKVSTVRSAALEMELDHESGAMNGMILVGQFEGQELNALERDTLLELRIEIDGDPDSLALLDAYLDRRFPHWREDAQADPGSGEAGSPGAGTMSEEEAYQVLGLANGASADDIRDAHRRLMKTAHPDTGGSTFLAAKINEAKDILLKGHS